MKTGIKNSIKIICFLLIVTVLGTYFAKVFGFKYGDGIYSLTKFYEEEDNSIDVLCFGSSHIFENVNTATLWDEYGVASFDLCGSVQPFWNTYYYMKEALKTQSPKVMVLDVYGAVQTKDYSDSSRIIKNNYGLQPSLDKLQSILASTPKEDQPDYLLEYPTYHSRYTEITAADFLPNQGNPLYEDWKGFGLNTKTKIMPQPVDFETNKVGELSDKVELYLRKIIQLSKEKKVPLILIVVPYSITEGHQEKYNRVQEIAEENDIPFVNYNLLSEEIGLDYSKDFADKSHMNQNGNVKFTKYFGEELKENYDIPDHRGESEYQSYDRMSQYVQWQIDDAEVSDTEEVNAYIESLQKEQYLVVYTAGGAYKKAENYEEIRNSLCAAGIDLNEGTENPLWVVDNQELIHQNNGEAADNWHFEVDDFTNLAIIKSGEATATPTITLGQESFVPVDGLNILVYDKSTKTLVENARFRLSEGIISCKKT